MPTDCLSEFAELLESQGLANSAVFYSVNQLLSRCNLNCVMSKRQRLICCTFGSFVWNATCYPCTLWNNDLLFISYTIYSLYHIRNVICNTVYDIIQWNFQHIAYEINNKSYIISYTYGFKSYDVVFQGHEILFSFYIMISLVSYARITCTNRMKLNNKSYLISHASLLHSTRAPNFIMRATDSSKAVSVPIKCSSCSFPLSVCQHWHQVKLSSLLIMQ